MSKKDDYGILFFLMRNLILDLPNTSHNKNGNILLNFFVLN